MVSVLVSLVVTVIFLVAAALLGRTSEQEASLMVS